MYDFLSEIFNNFPCLPYLNELVLTLKLVFSFVLAFVVVSIINEMYSYIIGSLNKAYKPKNENKRFDPNRR